MLWGRGPATVNEARYNLDVVIGRTISHYRITGKLGEGGMGVVYKAEDIRLGRPVALKFLTAQLLEDEEARQRFTREAKAAAALDHPNVCTIHEIDEADGRTFLAMAFLEGRTVKDKIAERPLKLDDALDIAIQTAQGLQAAHEKGIVHRDIKPANLMVTPQNQVKIMDFGLAQLAEQSRLTKTSTILGTPAYMSPEQAERKPTGQRTDIWSLGVTIYEMVTGKLPFEGERQAAVLYAISNQTPEPITALRAGLPMELEFIVGKALAKDPAERYQHAEELIVDLRAVSQGLESESLPRPAGAVVSPPAQRASSFRRLAVAAALVLVGVLAGVVAGRWGQPVEKALEPTYRRFTLAPSNLPFTVRDWAAASVSPNGDAIAYVARGDYAGRNVWLWDMAKDEARDLGVVSGGFDGPQWSPDGRFISVTHDWKLQKTPVRGGPAITICDLPREGFPNAAGHTWHPDGSSIVFSLGPPYKLYEVSASGGAPRLLTESTGSDESSAGFFPQFLPLTQGRRLLAYGIGSPQQSRLVVEDLDSHERVVLGDGARAVYSPTGHLLYQTAALTPGLMAIPFSLDRSQATGEAFSISANGFSPSFADDGTMVYLEDAGGQKRLGWWDRTGKKLADIGQPQRDLELPSLSPDGRLVGVEGVEDETGTDVWLHEVGRPVKRRLTMHPARDSRAVWTRDGKFVTFWSQRNGAQDIFMIPADGGEARLIYSTTGYQEPNDWSPDGKSLLLTSLVFRGLGYLRQEADGAGYEPTRYTQTDAFEWWGTFSPDGRYVAYCSDESGRFEVYVRPFPDGPGKEQVSINGGTQARWSRDGKELFYVEDDTLIAVKVATQPEFSMGAAARLFSSPNLVRPWPVPSYDVDLDGKRFVMIERVGDPKPPVIRVVENWFEEFRGRD